MRFRILRGACEIGGSCVQIEVRGKSILLDLGLPLDAPAPDEVSLPDLPGLADGSNDHLLGIILSHAHGDHCGLLPQAHRSFPVFMGEGTQRMLNAAAPFMPQAILPERVSHFHDRETFNLGPFRIIPYLTDHSAFDAYSLLIEADGKRLFYSGDFRAHGRKASLVQSLVRDPPSDIDVLLMEGTILSRDDLETPHKTEAQLEEEILASLQETERLALVWFSPQNIDRFVTIFRATKRSGRIFVADAYLANILDAIGLRSLPSPRARQIRMFLPGVQKRRIVRDRRFDLIEPYRASRIFLPELMTHPERWVMLFRPSMIDDLREPGKLAESRLIYSLWPGYLENDSFDIQAWCRACGIRFEIHHTSGHADLPTLKSFARAFNPGATVPIHTQAPERYCEHFANVKPVSDGEWFDM